MSLAVRGIGVVTPLGCDVSEVARRMARGDRGLRVERFDILAFTPAERLRRAPPISLFAVAAAARALEGSGLSSGGLDGARVAVIAAVSKGAMIYSSRFHSQFVKGGSRAVVPLLFPETVANAPASHVASVFGLCGPNATLLGDAAVAYNAIAMARDFLEWGLADAALVVAPHEHAEIMAEGYRRFRWVFRNPDFSEGAAALLLAREGPTHGEILHVDRGYPYRRRREIPALLSRALRDIPAEPSVVSVSGGEDLPYAVAVRVAVKASLGEAFAAGALWQMVFGLDRASPGQCVLSTCVGLNEQVSVLLARR